MKKRINKPMRAAGILLVATMLTTCMTAGTFAKYTTTDSATDSARVAKFGVVINANGALYGREYTGGELANSTPVAYTIVSSTPAPGTNDSTSVQAFTHNKDAIVAPGTKSGDGLGISIKGTPEVDVNVKYEIDAVNVYLGAGSYGVMAPITFETVDLLSEAINAAENAGSTDGTLFTKTSDTYTKVTNTNGYTDNTTQYYKLTNFVTLVADYYPVRYSLDGGTTDTKVADANDLSTNSFEAILGNNSGGFVKTLGGTVTTPVKGYMNAVNTAGVKVDANNSMESKINLSASKLQWQWVFEQTNNALYDKADTILGDLVAQDNPNNVNTVNGVDDTTFTTDGYKVVKLTLDGSGHPTTGTIPTKSTFDSTTGKLTNSSATDYNLYTSFKITLTATQVD